MSVRDTILIADDVELNRVILRGVFEKDYNLLEAENGEQAMLLIKQYHATIAVVLLDLIMPAKDGYQVMAEISGGGYLAEFPVVIITAEDSAENEVRAFDLGASDIVMKPFEPHVVRRRVQNLVELNLHKMNQDELIEEQAAKLRESNSVMIDALSSIIEYRSIETGQHIKRIRLFTKVLLEDVAKNYPEYLLEDHKIAIIVSASSMHDIGKIGIPDAILNKPGRLTPEEFEIMKTHTVKGCEMLSNLDRMTDREYLQYAYNICRYHHERWDGRGYPNGLKGESIPICAQVVGVTDCYDALTSDRVYKKALAPEQAVNMILNGDCGAFSPKLLECLKDVQADFKQLAFEYADGGPRSAELRQTRHLELPPAGEAVGMLQQGQAKYLSMLKYANATVMEFNLITGLYHLVYLSNSDFALLKSGSSFEESIRSFVDGAVHPDDRQHALELLDGYLTRFFVAGLMQRTRMYRVLNCASQHYHWCDATLLRLDTQNPEDRQALLIWQDTGEADSAGEPPRPDGQIECDQNMLQTIIEGIQVCANDRWLTMESLNSNVRELLGYSENDLTDRFQNRFINIINSNDRDQTLRSIASQLKNGTMAETEFRVDTKDGRQLWMLGKTQLIKGRDGNEHLYSVLIDITPSKKAQNELQLLMERYQIIIRQINDVIFEWDPDRDTMTYSSNWKEKFGHEPITESITTNIPKASHVHPEDIEELTHLMKDMRNGKSYEVIEVRIADARGRYRWCKIRAAAQTDSQGRLLKAIGVLSDIDAEKRASQELQEKAERDSLTGLYNRLTSQQRIESYLKQKEPNENSAMFIIDVDNFKQINDSYGHSFGDVVLQQVSSELQKLFRSGDIVARIGGDEFLIFMKDVREKEIVRARADKILQSFEHILWQNVRELHPSCSIGISFCPDDGSIFEDLFRRSDLALYNAKAQGKNRYKLYDRANMERKLGELLPTATAKTRIESGNHEIGLRLDLPDRIFRSLYSALDTGKAVEATISMLGLQLGVSRVYIFEDSDDGRCCVNTYEWCNEGILPRPEARKTINYSKPQNYRDLFDGDGIFYCPDTKTLPDWQKKLFEGQNVKSIINCAIGSAGRAKGFIGFDDCIIRRSWTKEQIDALAYIARIISAFLFKMRAEDRAGAQKQDSRTGEAVKAAS